MTDPVDVSFFARAAKPLTSYRPYWAKRFGTAAFLPMSRAEMEQLGWDCCDVILVTGDAYVDHPSFGMAVIGRTLEAQGFRVGIIAQPDWHSAEPFQRLGRPGLFWGVTAGNMDSMINRYTAERKLRSDDAYTPGDIGGRRPDRAAIVYSQRCREAYKEVPIILGGIEASLRRIAHYDYWSDKVRRSIVLDAKCDLLLYGNAERALVEVAHRLAAREPIGQITDVRGTAFVRRPGDASGQGWCEIDSTSVDQPGRVQQHVNPYLDSGAQTATQAAVQTAVQGSRCRPQDAAGAVAAGAGAASAAGDKGYQPIGFVANPALKSRPRPRPGLAPRERSVIRLPGYEQVRSDPVLYAHASRVLHQETNPGNARALVQAHGAGASARDVWINPPPIPLSTAELDHVFDLPYARSPHPVYADENGRHDGASKIPAWEMIRFSVNIMRGCFGGCSFCSITEHEGRIIQSRSEDSIIREIEDIRDKVEGFTGTISDLGGPTANMYRLGCRSPEIEAACRKPSCVYPGICQNLTTGHGPLVALYRRSRAVPGVRKILIGSGLRYDLALQSPEYIKELVQHHVGGYLKIAPEHTEPGPLAKMMKPGIASYEQFRQLFEKFSAEVGKKQFLIPYFIAAHPGTSDEDMLRLAIWLKKNGFRADQVQTFYPSPMASATAMYHSGKNPLRKVGRDSEAVDIVRGEKRRRLHKAFLRYHDPNNWPLLRAALKSMGRADLIGNGRQHLIPGMQPLTDGSYHSARRKNATPATPVASAPPSVPKGRLLTQHTGLPPRPIGAANPVAGRGWKNK
ncbi:YgiQ family radical SAM protein [Verminephrobacter eiseniae]|uniref:Radical SAM N-terminal domain protein n=1 Tax=Verminephrobacter eiseniae (strain EF01-2) TaxID=391735 RepID=A1WPG8_VEREI|nr:YgiQ family radical SAM protein [Verminephrobacter eiseniae]ABM59525.1 Radical SAM N-terminal domain protein [Verminephrobacter eiseniae EF01-2]MCW5285051.1 YgiQ family radical SAM protein [Verminephrobacter eiseniae]MCW5302758.1 YgiQ family radical SAM protein [Verminephrobacter eiseniae]MCW8181734.1 YgiQ family radical SAM protein [Verminephrobacter eiseniae]MCW8190777.1 YgiQ family radical SAM protein [Verminephrobacter eiseniae]